jgi:tyrosyl-tRNA synthetase
VSSPTGIVELAVATGLADSNNQAKRLLRDGGIKFGGENVGTDYVVDPGELPKVLSRGRARSVNLIPG